MSLSLYCARVQFHEHCQCADTLGFQGTGRETAVDLRILATVRSQELPCPQGKERKEVQALAAPQGEQRALNWSQVDEENGGGQRRRAFLTSGRLLFTYLSVCKLVMCLSMMIEI